MTRLIFTDARLIDPEAGTDTRGHLLVEDGRIAARLPEGRKHYNAAVADALLDVILRKKSTERYGLFLAVTLTNLMKLGALDYAERYLQRVVDVCEGGLGCRPAGV